MVQDKIQQDLNAAIKEKKELEVLVLRQIFSAVLNKEKEKRYKLSREKPEFSEEQLEKESQLTEEEVLEVIAGEAKKRREAVVAFEKGQRQDLAEKEKKELEILQKYLPEQISEEELRKLAAEAVRKLGAKDIKDMGRVMAELMPKVKGRADGAEVSKIIKELLS